MTTEAKAIVARTTTINLDKAIIVKSADGSEVRRIKRLMKLSVAEDTLVKILPAKKGWHNRKTNEDIPDKPATLIPTANAYMQLGATCGLCLNHPDTVIVDGKEQPNGFKDLNGTYYFRAKAGGYTANGQPFITDRTVDYNVHRYNIQDLLSKAKNEKYTQYFKIMPYEGRNEKDALLGSPEKGWAGYQIDEAVVLWVNCSAPEFVQWYGEMNNRIKNAIRTCQTFADRNAIAAHPALPSKKKFFATEAVVECVSWFATKGQVTFAQLESHGQVQIDVAAGTLTDAEGEEKQAVEAELKSSPVDASDAVEGEDGEEDDKSEAEQSPQTTPAASIPAPQKATQESTPEELDALTNEVCALDKQCKTSKPKTYAKIYKQMGLDPEKCYPADLAYEQLITLRSLLKASI